MALREGFPATAGERTEPVILIVGLPDSIHTARWINMVRGSGIRFVLLPVYAGEVNPELGKARFISNAEELACVPNDELAVFDLNSVPAEEIREAESRMRYESWQPGWLGGLVLTRPGHLAAAIERLRPTMVHSMIVQFGGYLCLACKEFLGDEFPAWLLSNWGSDMYLFRMLPDHQSRLSRIAALIDGYHAECERDVTIVKEMGFSGFVFPVLPASGGMDFSSFPRLESFRRPSQRREILVKGYHGWSGRGLQILSALHLAADALRGYKIRITLAGPSVTEMAQTMAEWDGLDIVLEPYLGSHYDALMRLSEARVVIGLGISDGISTTLLEAMAVGTFPIQGCGSCGNEWAVPNETGVLVSPHDTRMLADAIRRAVTDDALVDDAAPRNRAVVEARWNTKINGDVARRNYHAMIASVSERPTAHLSTPR